MSAKAASPKSSSIQQNQQNKKFTQSKQASIHLSQEKSIWAKRKSTEQPSFNERDFKCVNQMKSVLNKMMAFL